MRVCKVCSWMKGAHFKLALAVLLTELFDCQSFNLRPDDKISYLIQMASKFSEFLFFFFLWLIFMLIFYTIVNFASMNVMTTWRKSNQTFWSRLIWNVLFPNFESHSQLAHHTRVCVCVCLSLSLSLSLPAPRIKEIKLVFSVLIGSELKDTRYVFLISSAFMSRV